MLTAYLKASVSDQAAVDDLWQETMVTAWRRWDDYDKKRPFGAWLRGIARLNVLNWYRTQKKTEHSCDEVTLEHFENVFSRVNELVGDTFEDKLQALRDCIEGLPEIYRETVRLRYEESLKPAAMSSLQSTAIDTVKKRLQRAKAMLFECISLKLNQNPTSI